MVEIQKMNIIKSNNNLRIFDEIAKTNGFRKQIDYPTADIYIKDHF